MLAVRLNKPWKNKDRSDNPKLDNPTSGGNSAPSNLCPHQDCREYKDTLYPGHVNIILTFDMVATKITWESIKGKEHPVLSPAFVNNGLVYTSGVVGSHYGTGETPDDIEEQINLAIQNLESVLKAAGSSLDKVFKVTMFISHSDYSGIVNKVYGQYFTQKPARTCVVVAFMDAAIKCELEAIATLD